MKSLMKMNGAKLLSKTEQKSINGGKRYCDGSYPCLTGECCHQRACYAVGTPGRPCQPYL